MTDTPAAAPITAERELLQRAWDWMADNETAIFACSESAWKQMTLIAADLRAALSAQAAASGVDALWVERVMELADEYAQAMCFVPSLSDYEITAAREALCAHLKGGA